MKVIKGYEARVLDLPRGIEEGVYEEVDVRMDVDWFSGADVLIGSDISSSIPDTYVVAAVKEIPIRTIESNNDCVGFWYTLKFINPKQVYVKKRFLRGSRWIKIGTIDDFLTTNI